MTSNEQRAGAAATAPDPAPAGARPSFRPGRNIAIKAPVHEWESTVAFYRDVLGLAPDPDFPGDVFVFGDKRLWIDRVPHLGQTEIWLEIAADDLAAASDWLTSHGCVRCDAIEPLPEGFEGFWIAAPGNLIHLVGPT